VEKSSELGCVSFDRVQAQAFGLQLREARMLISHTAQVVQPYSRKRPGFWQSSSVQIAMDAVIHEASSLVHEAASSVSSSIASIASRGAQLPKTQSHGRGARHEEMLEADWGLKPLLSKMAVVFAGVFMLYVLRVTLRKRLHRQRLNRWQQEFARPKRRQPSNAKSSAISQRRQHANKGEPRLQSGILAAH